MSESYYIKNCLQQVENKLQWKPSTDWTDSDYRKLSNLINERSGISISHQTLKRLFGKVNYKEEYNPQQATKDALAKFIDYLDWDDFVKKTYLPASEEPSVEDIKPTAQKNKSGSLISFALIFLIVGLIIFIFIHIRGKNDFVFSVKNSSGTIPHTVEFDYDISNLNEDSVFLDCGYKHPVMGYQKILLNKKKTSIRHCFQIPNCYTVRLMAGNRTLAKAQIQVCSEGWVNLFKGSNISKEDQSLKDQDIFQYGLDDFINDTVRDGYLYFSPKTLLDHGMESRKVYYLENRNIRTYQAVADNCLLQIRFKNDPSEGGISCFDSHFSIIGKTGVADISLMQKGCSRWSSARFGEVIKDGEYNDMSSLSRDLNAWQNLRICIKNKKALVIADADTIYQCEYSQPIDSIKGLILFFKGSAKVDYVRLYDNRDSCIFQDDF